MRKKLNIIFPYLLIIIAIGFNIYTLFPEISIKADPNDNIFQFALVYRANDVLEKVANKQLPPLSTVDHWVSYWASGYPLPLYYQHLPHLSVALLYNLLFRTFSLYSVFNFVKFLLWVFLPASFYLSCRWLGLSRLQSALSAFFGSQILTDGLFGFDISSFAFRGYGLYTQLVAIFFAPMAWGKAYQLLTNQEKGIGRKDFLLAVFLLVATFSSHMAIGYMVALSSFFIPLIFNKVNLKSLGLIKNWEKEVKQLLSSYFPLFLLLFCSFALLAYWFIPLLSGNIYHNISFWDPPVKWNSYGLRETVVMFLNGALFDFNRPPVLTIFIIIGFLYCLYNFKEKKSKFFLLNFVLMFCLYLGRTTWEKLIDLLPMMREMHQQRLINGLHLVSLPLIGMGAGLIVQKIKRPLWGMLLIIVLGFVVFRANADYLAYNKTLLDDSNSNYEKVSQDFEALVAKLKSLPPGRIHAGAPGNWGRQFNLGSTQMYLVLSTKGFDIVDFLPESWSLNSELESFFNDQRLDDYLLYNVKYLVTPPEINPPSFAKKIDAFGSFNLWQIETPGYFDIGTSNLLVKSDKEDFLNMEHLWLRSDLPLKKEFPTLLLKGKEPSLPYRTRITLKGTNLYEKEGKDFSLYSLAYVLNPQPEILGKIIAETIKDQLYQTTIEVDKDCQSCLVIFKMTYHPNWTAKVDGKTAEKIMVFPSFMAVKIEPGIHNVSFQYSPDRRKFPLLLIGTGLFCLIVYSWKKINFKNPLGLLKD